MAPDSPEKTEEINRSAQPSEIIWPHGNPELVEHQAPASGSLQRPDDPDEAGKFRDLRSSRTLP